VYNDFPPAKNVNFDKNPGFLRRLDGWSSCQQKPHDQAGTFPLKVKDFYDEKFSRGSCENCNIFHYNILAKKCFKAQNLYGIFRKFRDIRFWLHLTAKFFVEYDECYLLHEALLIVMSFSGVCGAIDGLTEKKTEICN
jgi:hypothetical protein